MSAIGTGWATAAWIEASWVTEAWDDDPNVPVVVSDVAPTGGWSGWYDVYDHHKRQREKKRDEVFEEIKAIEGVDAEIAKLLHKDMEAEAREAELANLEQMVRSSYTKRQADELKRYNERVAIAYIRAAEQGNYSAVEAFEREMERTREEEEFLFLAMAIL